MKHNRIGTIAYLACLVMMLGTPLVAQTRRDPRAEARARRVDSRTARTARSRNRLQLSKIKKLQVEMRKELRLSRNQLNEVDRLFDEFRKQSENAGGGVTSEADRRSKALQYRQSMINAKRRGDAAALREAHGKLQALRTSAAHFDFDDVPDLIGKLRNELNEGQKSKFDEIVKNLKIKSARFEETVDLRLLMRTVRSAALGLTNRQRSTLMHILQDGMAKESAAQRKGDDEEAKRVTNDTRDAVYAELSPIQKSRLLERLHSRQIDVQAPDASDDGSTTTDDGANTKDDAPPTDDGGGR